MLIILDSGVVNLDNAVDFIVQKTDSKECYIALRTVKGEYNIKSFDNESSARSYLINNLPKIIEKSVKKDDVYIDFRSL